MTGNRLFVKAIMSYFRSKPLRIFFTVLWFIFVCLIIFLGSEPSPHSFDIYDDNTPEPYQTGLVVFLITAMVLHLAALIIIDILMHSNWKLPLMLLITMLFLLYFGMLAMHASPSLVWMIFWTFLSSLLFLLLCFWQVYLFVLRRIFRRD